ncbi:MAG: fibronectin type III domain-containing protein, partial [Treponema sp.]|nr:fibronectin type III domain-containing protein [Treponema sp.]
MEAQAADRAVMLSWENPQDDDFKGLIISASPPEGPLASPVTVGKEVNAFLAGGLNNNVPYEFKIKTVDSSGNESGWESVTATPEAPDFQNEDPPPADAASFDAVGSHHLVTLSWTNPDDEDFFGLELSVEPAAGSLAAPLILKGTAGASLNFQVTGLSVEQDYTFKIRSLDKALNLSEGVEKECRPLDLSDTVPPHEVSGFNVEAGDGAAVLSWTNPGDGDFAGVEISADPQAGSLSAPLILGKTVTAFKTAGLTNGTLYTFTVKTIDTSSNKSTGAQETGLPSASPGDTTPPANVRGLNAVPGHGNVALSWENPEDGDFYGVEISAVPAAGVLSVPLIIKKGSESFTVTGLKVSHQYSFRVVSLDDSLNESVGVSTTAATLDTGDHTPPGKAANVNAEPGDGTVFLSWANPDDEDGDFAGLEISASPQAPGFPVRISPVAAYLAAGLTNGTSYTFTVKAIDTSGNLSEGTESAEVTPQAYSPDLTGPGGAGGLRAEPGLNSITLSWTNPGDDDFKGVEISIRLVSDNSLVGKVFLEGAKSAADSYFAGGLSASTRYKFTVISYDTAFNPCPPDAYAEITIATLSPDIPDTTAPADVIDLTAEAMDEAVKLSWDETSAASAQDLYGFEVSWNQPNAGVGRAMMPLEPRTLYVAKGKKGVIVDGLINNVAYTFTVKSVDTSGNKSSGAQTTKAPTPPAPPAGVPLAVTLTPSTTDLVISLKVAAA